MKLNLTPDTPGIDIEMDMQDEQELDREYGRYSYNRPQSEVTIEFDGIEYSRNGFIIEVRRLQSLENAADKRQEAWMEILAEKAAIVDNLKATVDYLYRKYVLKEEEFGE